MEYKMGTAPAEWKPAPRVCRCCLSEGCYKDISTEYYWLGEKEMYSQMLKECFDLTISLSEAAGNSRLICEVCITRLRDASNFKKQVINSEKRFAEHLRSGASLSVVEVQENPVLVDIKIEGVKDEAAISDDDPDPVDDDIGDPDYDESDDLPLKFEVQKKESMTELSFGDEIPALNTSETTIRKVSSRTKEKSALKKLKMNKKELTIKPVKAGSSKKKDKEAKAKVKAAKPGPKKEQSAQTLTKPPVKLTAAAILESSTVTPFRWANNSFLCIFCEEKFVAIEQLRNHHRENWNHDTKHTAHGEIGPVNIDLVDAACAVCGYGIVSIEDFKLHLKFVHDMDLDLGTAGVAPVFLRNNELNCGKCTESFTDFVELYKHMNDHYPKFICNTCGKRFTTAQKLGKHHSWHNKGLYTCMHCEQTFPTKEDRQNHLIEVHPKAPRYQCTVCPERFLYYFQRLSHLSEVHNVKSAYKCDHCEMIFDSAKRRLSHVRSTHVPPVKKFVCHLCPWRFVTGSELKSHLTTHSRERNFKCDTCEKLFRSAKILERHIRFIHQNNDPLQPLELPHRCPQCPERFRTHDGRVKHLTDAHGMEQKLYNCYVCSMTFKRRSARHAHMQAAHNCGNNYACPHCSAVFVTETKRDEHVARHVCTVCGKVYAGRKSLRAHMKLHAREQSASSMTSDGGPAMGHPEIHVRQQLAPAMPGVGGATVGNPDVNMQEQLATAMPDLGGATMGNPDTNMQEQFAPAMPDTGGAEMGHPDVHMREQLAPEMRGADGVGMGHLEIHVPGQLAPAMPDVARAGIGHTDIHAREHLAPEAPEVVGAAIGHPDIHEREHFAPSMPGVGGAAMEHPDIHMREHVASAIRGPGEAAMGHPDIHVREQFAQVMPGVGGAAMEHPDIHLAEQMAHTMRGVGGAAMRHPGFHPREQLAPAMAVIGGAAMGHPDIHAREQFAPSIPGVDGAAMGLPDFHRMHEFIRKHM